MLTQSDLPLMLVDGTKDNMSIDEQFISPLENGDIVKIEIRNKKVDGFAYVHDGSLIFIEPSKDRPNIPFDIYDEVEMSRGDIANWLGPKGITTIGRYVLNYVMLASIFDNKIEYVNDIWKIEKIEDVISKGLVVGEFNMDQYRKYIDHGYYLGHFAEMCVPTISRKSMTTDPKVEVRKRELLKKYAGQLNDPNVIAAIEDELMKIDKEWLKGDDALGFHEGIGGKSFDVHRKKMLLTVGGIEAFDTDGGSFNFVGNSLSEGWEKKDFPVIANDVRKGSFARGNETWKGGALTKYILRVFQDVKIIEDDCKTAQGLRGKFNEKVMKSLVGRTILQSGKYVMLTEENYKSYIGKEILLRSPTHCQTKQGLCYTCCGENFRLLGVEAIGPQAVEISSRFMMASMKAMHGTKLQVTNVDHNDFFIESK